MPEYSVTIEFEKPAPLKTWDSSLMAKIEREWFELRKVKGIPLSLTTTSTATPSDEFWRYHFRLHDADISSLLGAIEESELATPYKCFYRIEEAWASRDEYDQLQLKQLKYLMDAPIADLIQCTQLFLLKEADAWIKDMPVVDRALLEDPENSWKATLCYGDESVAHASANLLAYSRRGEFYEHLEKGGEQTLEGTPFSYVAKTLGIWVPTQEVAFDFSGDFESDLEKARIINWTLRSDYRKTDYVF